MASRRRKVRYKSPSTPWSVLIFLQGVVQWDSKEQAQEFFQGVIGKAHICMKQSEISAKENVEELATLCRTELLDLLQKIAERKVTNQSLQAIIAAKIASLQGTTSVLYSEIRSQIEKSGPKERWKEADMKENLVRKFVSALTRRNWIRKSTSLAKGLISHGPRPSFMERSASNAGLSAPSSASSSRAALSRSQTPTPSNDSITHSTSNARSSQQFLRRIHEGGQAATVNEMITSRAEEYMVGRSSTLDSSSESSLPVMEVEPRLDYQDICSSSKKLSAYVSTNVVNPFLQDVRTNITRLAGARLHDMEKVYERTILGVMAEYEEAIKMEEDQRQRIPQDQRVRRTLAQLQLGKRHCGGFCH